jgi:deoxycytidylate deaminase
LQENCQMELINPSIKKVMMRLAKQRKEQLESMMNMDNWDRGLSLELDQVNQYISDNE